MNISLLGCGWLGLPFGQALALQGHTVWGSVTHADKLPVLERAGIRGLQLELTPAITGDPEEFFGADVLVITLPPKRSEAGAKERYPAQLAAALAATPAHTHLVFTSSTSVYPELSRTVTERDAGGSLATPLSDSGQAVLAAEALVRARGGTILRLAGLYGYDRQPGRRLAGRTLSGGAVPVNLVHRDDVLRVLLKVLEEGVTGVFNVCADQHPTRQAVYTQQAERYGFAPPRFAEPAQQPYKCVSSAALKAALGFTFRYPDPLEPAP